MYMATECHDKIWDIRNHHCIFFLLNNSSYYYCSQSDLRNRQLTPCMQWYWTWSPLMILEIRSRHYVLNPERSQNVAMRLRLSTSQVLHYFSDSYVAPATLGTRAAEYKSVTEESIHNCLIRCSLDMWTAKHYVYIEVSALVHLLFCFNINVYLFWDDSIEGLSQKVSYKQQYVIHFVNNTLPEKSYSDPMLLSVKNTLD